MSKLSLDVLHGEVYDFLERLEAKVFGRSLTEAETEALHSEIVKAIELNVSESFDYNYN